MFNRWSALGALGLFVGFFIDGLAVTVCWNWFVSPTLNVPTITFVPAIGFRLLAAAILRPTVIPGPSPDEINQQITMEGKSLSRVVVEWGLLHHLGARFSILAMATLWHLLSLGS